MDTTNLSTFAPGTTIFEESNLFQKGGESLHVNSSEQSVGIIRKLMGSSKHWCMLYATVKYVADLPETTIDVARRNTSASVQVVSTPRNELSNPTQSKSDVLAEGNLT